LPLHREKKFNNIFSSTHTRQFSLQTALAVALLFVCVAKHGKCTSVVIM
jgi:hypothetical protein